MTERHNERLTERLTGARQREIETDRCESDRDRETGREFDRKREGGGDAFYCAQQ